MLVPNYQQQYIGIPPAVSDNADDLPAKLQHTDDRMINQTCCDI